MSTAHINTLDIKAIRNDFPILARMVNGKPLVYFDNAQHLKSLNWLLMQLYTITAISMLISIEEFTL